MGNLPIHSNSLVKFHNFNSIMINGQVDNLLFLFLFSLNHPFFPCPLPLIPTSFFLSLLHCFSCCYGIYLYCHLENLREKNDQDS